MDSPQASQTPGAPLGGGKVRERRRLSAEAPYKKQKTAMPATRHSPTRAAQSQAPAQLPLSDIVQELALLRKAMEGGFVEAGKKSDSIRDELVGKLEANDQAVSELQLAVTDVTLSVDQNQRAIHEVRAEVERREIELPDKVRAIVNEALDRPSRSMPGPGIRARPLRRASGSANAAEPPEEPGDVDNRKEKAYDLARRSLKLWPVSREGSLAERTVEFLVNELRLDQQHASNLRLTVRRVGGAAGREPSRQTAVKDEVLVSFETVRERDDVRSFAKNLERKGRGLRREIPDHLWPSFRVLQQLAYELKKKNPSLKRNILFDDDRRDLKMDISTDSTTWRTVLPADARKSLQRCRPERQRRVSVSREEIDRMLGPADEEQDNMDAEEY